MEMLPVVFVAFLALHMAPIGRLTPLCLNLLRVLPLCQTDRSKISGNTSEENGTTFSDLTGPTKRNGYCHFEFFFPNSLISGKNWFVKNGTTNFGRNITDRNNFQR